MTVREHRDPGEGHSPHGLAREHIWKSMQDTGVSSLETGPRQSITPV